MEKETIYKIETTNRDEAILMLNTISMAQALYDLMQWRMAIYNGKSYDTSYLVNGKIMSQNEFFNYETSSEDSIKNIYLEEDIEHKLNEILESVESIIQEYYY